MRKLLPSEIAENDARRLAVVLSEVGGDGAPIGGGWMACDVPGSWAKYAAGLGVDGAVDGAVLDELVAFYRERDRTPRIEVTPYQHPTLVEGLASRGFTPYSFDTVLVRTTDALPQEAPISGLAFRRVDPANDEDVHDFRDSQMAGFYESGNVPSGMLPITERVARSHRNQLWLLELEGTVVGSGGLEIFGESALMIAGCVHPEARRQGVHLAFMQFRLEQARAAGLHSLTVGTKPGGPTERNALRAGFTPVYTQLGLCQTAPPARS